MFPGLGSDTRSLADGGSDVSGLDLFPVVLEKWLPIPERERWGVWKWPPEGLPEPPAGMVLVFQVRGEHHLWTGQGALRWEDRHLARANAVAVVDMRPRVLAVEIDLESPKLDELLTLRVSFRCQVVDAVAVARMGLCNIFPELDGYVRMALRQVPSPELISSRLLAQLAVSPPEMIGMHIRPISVQLSVVEE